MKSTTDATRRFRLSSNLGVDFPTIKTGRVRNRLGRVRGVDCELFGSALRCGLVDGAPKLREIRLTTLASDREAVAGEPIFEKGTVSVTVLFDAREALDASEDEIRWRILRAGLLALGAVARRAEAGQAVVAALESTHEVVPAGNFPAFPEASQQDVDLYYRYETFSKGKASRRLTIVLSPSGRDCPDHDFQPVFNALMEAFTQHRLGSWVGDSQDEIEFKCRDVQAAIAFVESYLPRIFDGGFTLVTDKD
ncbi:hypothetical protein [Arenimonas sp.]|uniref:hypothetical protein n=1 Tax=Arenimonas sp. TaxID=1872635 RepID=UPI0035B11D61